MAEMGFYNYKLYFHSCKTLLLVSVLNLKPSKCGVIDNKKKRSLGRRTEARCNMSRGCQRGTAGVGDPLICLPVNCLTLCLLPPRLSVILLHTTSLILHFHRVHTFLFSSLFTCLPTGQKTGTSQFHQAQQVFCLHPEC